MRGNENLEISVIAELVGEVSDTLHSLGVDMVLFLDVGVGSNKKLIKTVN